MQRHYDSIQELDAEVLAISTDDLSGAESIAQQVGIDFPVLYTSKDNSVPKAYNVFNLFGDGLASASVFIINKNGEIAYENIGSNYRHQVSANTVIANIP